MLDSAYKVLAIFTLTHKAISIDTDKTSGTFRKKVARYAEIDNDTGKYTVSAFLIAQFGKNMSPEIEDVPGGNELMVCAMKALLKARHMIGGGVVYLECEDKPALLHFYQNESNKFQPFGALHIDTGQHKLHTTPPLLLKRTPHPRTSFLISYNLFSSFITPAIIGEAFSAKIIIIPSTCVSIQPGASDIIVTA